MRIIIFKLTSIVIIVTFLSQNIVWPTPVQKPLELSHQPSANFYIPEQYGRIDKSTVNSPQSTEKNNTVDYGLSTMDSPTRLTVVLVKDAHCHYEAQRNIAKILDILIKDYGIDLVGVEGAGGKVDPSVIAGSPDAKKRKEVADKYLKKGWLTASEVLAMEKGKDYGFSIYGVEDLRLYLNDLKAFRDVYSGSGVAERFIEIAENLVSSLKNRLYAKDVLDFDKKIKEYRGNTIPLTELIEYLYSIDNIRFKGYPNLQLALKAILLEEAIDFDKVEKERAALIRECEKKLPKEELEQLVQKSLLYKLGKISSLEYYEYLERQLLLMRHSAFVTIGKKLSLRGVTPTLRRGNDEVISSEIASASPRNDRWSFTNLMRYIHLTKLHSKIDENRLFKGIDALIEDIYKKHITDEIAWKFHAIDNQIYLLSKLYRLEITKNELIRYMGSGLTINNIIEFLKIQGVINKIIIPDEINDEDFLKGVGRFSECPTEFYKYALERDSAIIENLTKKMEDTGKDKAVLIVGGFHADGAERLLKEKGIQVITITPSITKEDAEAKKIYLSRMLDERIQPERIMAEFGIKNLSTMPITAEELRNVFMPMLDEIITDPVRKSILREALTSVSRKEDIAEVIRKNLTRTELENAIKRLKNRKEPASVVAVGIFEKLIEIKRTEGINAIAYKGVNGIRCAEEAKKSNKRANYHVESIRLKLKQIKRGLLVNAEKLAEEEKEAVVSAMDNIRNIKLSNHKARVWDEDDYFLGAENCVCQNLLDYLLEKETHMHNDYILVLQYFLFAALLARLRGDIENKSKRALEILNLLFAQYTDEYKLEKTLIGYIKEQSEVTRLINEIKGRREIYPEIRANSKEEFQVVNIYLWERGDGFGNPGAMYALVKNLSQREEFKEKKVNIILTKYSFKCNLGEDIVASDARRVIGLLRNIKDVNIIYLEKPEDVVKSDISIFIGTYEKWDSIKEDIGEDNSRLHSNDGSKVKIFVPVYESSETMFHILENQAAGQKFYYLPSGLNKPEEDIGSSYRKYGIFLDPDLIDGSQRLKTEPPDIIETQRGKVLERIIESKPETKEEVALPLNNNDLIRSAWLIAYYQKKGHSAQDPFAEYIKALEIAAETPGAFPPEGITVFRIPGTTVSGRPKKDTIEYEERVLANGVKLRIVSLDFLNPELFKEILLLTGKINDGRGLVSLPCLVTGNSSLSQAISAGKIFVHDGYYIGHGSDKSKDKNFLSDITIVLRSFASSEFKVGINLIQDIDLLSRYFTDYGYADLFSKFSDYIQKNYDYTDGLTRFIVSIAEKQDFSGKKSPDLEKYDYIKAIKKAKKDRIVKSLGYRITMWMQEIIEWIGANLNKPIFNTGRDIDLCGTYHALSEVDIYVKINELLKGPSQDKPVRILDIGCGRGHFLKGLRKRYNEKFNEGKILFYGTTLVEYKGLKKLREDGVDIRCCRAEDLPFDDDFFDFVISTHALQYAYDPLVSIEEAHRVLAPGGFASLSFARKNNVLQKITGQGGTGIINIPGDAEGDVKCIEAFPLLPDAEDEIYIVRLNKDNDEVFFFPLERNIRIEVGLVGFRGKVRKVVYHRLPIVDSRPSISSTGVGNELQANRNILIGILDIALRKGKITQDDYNRRLNEFDRTGGMTSSFEDIDLEVDNQNVFIINDHRVIVIDTAEVLSVTEEGEQYVSAGLRRGTVYITRSKYDKLSPEELQKTIQHEVDEVNFLRNKADEEYGIDNPDRYTLMSQWLKYPANSEEAKMLIESAHQYAEKMAVGHSAAIGDICPYDLIEMLLKDIPPEDKWGNLFWGDIAITSDKEVVVIMKCKSSRSTSGFAYDIWIESPSGRIVAKKIITIRKGVELTADELDKFENLIEVITAGVNDHAKVKQELRRIRTQIQEDKERREKEWKASPEYLRRKKSLEELKQQNSRISSIHHDQVSLEMFLRVITILYRINENNEDITINDPDWLDTGTTHARYGMTWMFGRAHPEEQGNLWQYRGENPYKSKERGTYNRETFLDVKGYQRPRERNYTEFYMGMNVKLITDKDNKGVRFMIVPRGQGNAEASKIFIICQRLLQEGIPISFAEDEDFRDFIASYLRISRDDEEITRFFSTVDSETTGIFTPKSGMSEAVRELLLDEKRRPEPLQVRDFSEEDIRLGAQLAFGNEGIKYFDTLKQSNAYKILQAILPYLYEMVKIVLEEFEGHKILVCGRDAESFYDALKIMLEGTTAADNVYLFPGSMAFWMENHPRKYKKDKKLRNKMMEYLKTMGISREDIDNGQKYLVLDTGFHGTIGKFLHWAVAELYGYDYNIEGEKILNAILIRLVFANDYAYKHARQLMTVQKDENAEILRQKLSELGFYSIKEGDENAIICGAMQMLPKHHGAYCSLGENEKNEVIAVPEKTTRFVEYPNLDLDPNPEAVNPVMAILVQKLVIDYFMKSERQAKQPTPITIEPSGKGGTSDTSNIGKGVEFKKIDETSLKITLPNGENVSVNTEVYQLEKSRVKSIGKLVNRLNVSKEEGFEGFVAYLKGIRNVMVFEGTNETRAAGALAHMSDGVLYIDGIFFKNEDVPVSDMVIIHEAIHAYLKEKIKGMENSEVKDLEYLINNSFMDDKLKKKAIAKAAGFKTPEEQASYLIHYYARYYLQNPKDKGYDNSENQRLTEVIHRIIIENKYKTRQEILFKYGTEWRPAEIVSVGKEPRVESGINFGYPINIKFLDSSIPPLTVYSKDAWRWIRMPEDAASAEGDTDSELKLMFEIKKSIERFRENMEEAFAEDIAKGDYSFGRLMSIVNIIKEDVKSIASKLPKGQRIVDEEITRKLIAMIKSRDVDIVNIKDYKKVMRLVKMINDLKNRLQRLNDIFISEDEKYRRTESIKRSLKKAVEMSIGLGLLSKSKAETVPDIEGVVDKIDERLSYIWACSPFSIAQLKDFLKSVGSREAGFCLLRCRQESILLIAREMSDVFNSMLGAVGAVFVPFASLMLSTVVQGHSHPRYSSANDIDSKNAEKAWKNSRIPHFIISLDKDTREFFLFVYKGEGEWEQFSGDEECIPKLVELGVLRGQLRKKDKPKVTRRGYGGEKDSELNPGIIEAIESRNFICVDGKTVKSAGLTVDGSAEPVMGNLPLGDSERINLKEAINSLSVDDKKILEGVLLVFIPGQKAHYGLSRPQVYLDKDLLGNGKTDALARRLHHELQERKRVMESMNKQSRTYKDWQGRRGEGIIEDKIREFSEAIHRELVIEELSESLGLDKKEVAKALKGRSIGLLHTLRELLTVDVTSESELRDRLGIIFESAEEVVGVLDSLWNDIPENIKKNISNVREALTMCVAIEKLENLEGEQEEERMPRFMRDLKSKFAEMGFDADMVEGLIKEVEDSGGFYVEGEEIKISPYFEIMLSAIAGMVPKAGEELKILRRYKYAKAEARRVFKIGNAEPQDVNKNEVFEIVKIFLKGRGMEDTKIAGKFIEIIARYKADEEEFLSMFKDKERNGIRNGIEAFLGRTDWRDDGIFNIKPMEGKDMFSIIKNSLIAINTELELNLEGVKTEQEIPDVIDASLLVGDDGESLYAEAIVGDIKAMADKGTLRILYSNIRQKKKIENWLKERKIIGVEFIDIGEVGTEVVKMNNGAVWMLSDSIAHSVTGQLPSNHRIVKGQKKPEDNDLILMSKIRRVLKLGQKDIKKALEGLYRTYYRIGGFPEDKINEIVQEAMNQIDKGGLIVIDLPPALPVMRVFMLMLKYTRETVASAA